jgi:hypothetical protein
MVAVHVTPCAISPRDNNFNSKDIVGAQLKKKADV